MSLRSNRSRLLVALLAFLVLLSIRLSVARIYQVDEVQNIYMARIIGTHQVGRYFTNAGLWLLGPMAWLAGSATVSADLFLYNRLLFLWVFWVNITLLALNSGVRLRGWQGLAVLAGAATLAPLWDYGFEVRHDNLLLMGILVIWYVGRTRPRGVLAYVLLGFLGVLMQFMAFKSFVYTIPLTVAFLGFPPPGHRTGRLRLLLAWAVGGVAAYLLCRFIYLRSGLWGVQAASAAILAKGSMQVRRFSPWGTLTRTLTQTPLLLAVAVAAVGFQARRMVQQGRAAWTWAGQLPEVLLWLGSLVALAINPTPFPYNLVNIVPFAFLLAVRFLPEAVAGLEGNPVQVALAAGILVFTHGTPFLVATMRHLDRTNTRQETLMAEAEALTDPVQDPVYDGAGMVPTRASIGYLWYLHSLNIHEFWDKEGLRLRDMMAANPPAVFIPNYRMTWLPREDWDFVRAHYLPLANDFWVLGQALPAGGGPMAVLRGGRYGIYVANGTLLQVADGVKVDGIPVAPGPLRLDQGSHMLVDGAKQRVVVLWLGPKAATLPPLGPGDPLELFVNWY